MQLGTNQRPLGRNIMLAQQKTARVAGLDAVRAVAALSVLMTHLGNPFALHSLASWVIQWYHILFSWLVWCNGGLHPGVVVFIALSGFCIHLPRATTATRTLSWRQYARRRFLRIYPVLLVAMVLGGMVTWIVEGRSVVSFKAFLANCLLLRGVAGVDPPFGNPILQTVITECWLYAVYPFGLIIVRRGSWLLLFAGAAVVQVANITLLRIIGGDPAWAGSNLYALLLYWWLGAYAAERASLAHTPREGHLRLLVTGYACYVALSHLLSFAGSHYLKSLALALLSSWAMEGILIAQRASLSRTWHRWLGWLEAVGRASYSLYVVHLPVLTLAAFVAAARGYATGWPKATFCLGTVGIAVTFFYRLVELPAHRYSRQAPHRSQCR